MYNINIGFNETCIRVLNFEQCENDYHLCDV